MKQSFTYEVDTLSTKKKNEHMVNLGLAFRNLLDDNAAEEEEKSNE